MEKLPGGISRGGMVALMGSWMKIKIISTLLQGIAVLISILEVTHAMMMREIGARSGSKFVPRGFCIELPTGWITGV
jgi:hypothetical protein